MGRSKRIRQERNQMMGRVTIHEEAPPHHPIYTEAVFTIGARLTQSAESSVTKSTGDEVEAERESKASSDSKHRLSVTRK